MILKFKKNKENDNFNNLMNKSKGDYDIFMHLSREMIRASMRTRGIFDEDIYSLKQIAKLHNVEIKIL